MEIKSALQTGSCRKKYNLNLMLNERDLSFELKGGQTLINGSGLDGFLLILEKYGKMIDRVDFSASSGSFTFSRQVYLALNLLSSACECEVYFNGKKIAKNKILLPRYQSGKLNQKTK